MQRLKLFCDHIDGDATHSSGAQNPGVSQNHLNPTMNADYARSQTLPGVTILSRVPNSALHLSLILQPSTDLKGLTMIFAGQENPFIIFRSKEMFIYFKTNNKIPINLLK